MQLTTKHRRFIVALLEQPTIKEAAQAAGISERAAHNWLADSDFRAELDAAEAALIEAVSRQISTAADEATQVLRGVMTDEDSTVGEKIRAARAVLTALPQLRLLGSIERKLSELSERNI